jgi:hypothetical protein
VLESKTKWWVISSIALLTPAVLLVHGYHPLADDGAVYVTGIKKLANPGLYQSDAVFALSPTRLSVFAHLLAPPTHWVPLPDLLLVCQVASIFLFLLGSWRVANQLFSTRRARWGAVLLAACCFTLPVAGTSLSIMDPYVTARSFSTPLGLFALAAVLEENWAWSIFWLALAALLHPLMAVYSAIATFTVALSQRRLWRSLCVFYGLGWLLCAVIFIARPPGLKPSIDLPGRSRGLESPLPRTEVRGYTQPAVWGSSRIYFLPGCLKGFTLRPPRLNRLRKNSVSREILALWIGVLCRPFGTRAIDLTYPALTCRATDCSVPAGLASLQYQSPFEPQQARKDAVADKQELSACLKLHSGNIAFPQPVKPSLYMPAYSRGLESPLPQTKVRGFHLSVLPETEDAHRDEAATAYSGAALSRSYFFLSSWKWYEYPGLLIPLLLLAAAGTNKQAPWRTRALAIAATLMGGCALLVSLCFVHRSGSLLLARLQVLRGFQFVYIAGVLLTGGLLAKLRPRTITALCLLIAGALFTGQRLTYPESNHVEWPELTPRNRWQQAFLWIRSETPDNAIFALDNDYIESPGEDAQGFRASAERSAVPDWYKDGGIASNFPQAAIPWWEGIHATENLNSATDAQRLARLKPFGATWIVLPAEASTGFPCPFINARVRVCRVAVSHADGAK